MTEETLIFKMRVVLHVGKLLVIILVAWLLALIFLTGSLHRNNESEEALAKKLIDAQSETLSYKRELGIAAAGVSIAFVFSALFVGLHRLNSQVVTAINVIVLVLCTILIVYMSILFNTNWSLTWLAAFMVSGAAEIILFQTLLWPIVSAIFKS